MLIFAFENVIKNKIKFTKGIQMKNLTTLLEENRRLIEQGLEIKKLHYTSKDEKEKESLQKKLKTIKKDITLNNKFINVLSSGLNEANFLFQLEEKEDELRRILWNYEEWRKNTPTPEQGNKPQNTYNKLNGVARKKNQIKFLKQLLEL